MTSATLKLILQLKDEASAGLASVQGALQGLGGAALAGTAAGLAGVAAAALSTAGSFAEAQRQMQAQLGVTASEAAALSDVSREVFGNNFGADVADASAAVAELQQRLGLLGTEGPEALQAATESAFALRDVFGVDVAESAAAAQALMTEFGLSSTEAFNLITTGFQRGLNSSGDFLETIGEYSNLFAENGQSADQFFSVLETGLASGVLGTDKIADAFKESGIRIRELSDDVIGAFEGIGYAWAEQLDVNPADFNAYADAVIAGLAEMGLNAESFRAQLESGAIHGGAVYRDVLAAAIADGTLSIADAQNLAIQGLGQMDNAIHQNSAGVALFGTQWEDLGASIVLGVDTANTSLADMAGATDSLNVKYESLGAVASTIWRQALLTLAPFGSALLDLANAGMPLLLGAFAAVQPMLAGLASWMSGAAASLGTLAAAATGGELGAFTQILTTLGSVAQSLLMPALAGIATVLGGALLVAIGGAIASFLAAAAPLIALGAAAAAMYVAWQTNFGNIQGIVQTIWAIIQTVFGAITGFLQTHGATIQTIFSTVWGVMVTIVQTQMAVMHGVLQTVLALLQGDWDGAFNAMKDTLSTLTGEFVSLATSLGKAVVDGIVNGIKAGVQFVADAAKNLANSAIDAAKNALGISSPSKVFEFDIGPEVPIALVRAFKRGQAMVSQAAGNLASAVTAPFAPVTGGSFVAGAPMVPAGAPAGGGGMNVSNAISVPITIGGDVDRRSMPGIQEQIREAVKQGVNEAMGKTASRADVAIRLKRQQR